MNAAISSANTTQDVKYANLYGRNRIINGDFSINQRGFSSTLLDSTFGFDRWKFLKTGGTGAHSRQAIDSGTLLIDLPEAPRAYARLESAGQSAATDRTALYQTIESVRTLSGKTATISFWARVAIGTLPASVAVEVYQIMGSGGGGSFSTPAGKVAISSTWQRYSLTVNIPSVINKSLGPNSDDALGIIIYTSAGSSFNTQTTSLGIQNKTIDIWGVQVEEGSYATPYEQKSYADELRACQRFYWKHRGTGLYGRYGAGVVSTSLTLAYVEIPFPVPMRVPPAEFTYSGSLMGYDGSVNLYVTLTQDNQSIYQSNLSLTPTSGTFTATGRACLLTNYNDANGWIAFGAEL
jgi:hypothetical protein